MDPLLDVACESLSRTQVGSNDTNSVDEDEDEEQPGLAPTVHLIDWGMRLAGKTHMRELAVLNTGSGSLPFKVQGPLVYDGL